MVIVFLPEVAVLVTEDIIGILIVQNNDLFYASMESLQEQVEYQG